MSLLSKIMRETIAFITDDLVTAAFVIVWIAFFALIICEAHVNGTALAIAYLCGLLALFCFGVWRRARS